MTKDNSVRIFDLQGFSGGESDDVTYGPKNSFFSAENVEIRKNISGPSLSCKMTDTGWSINGNICYVGGLDEMGVQNGGTVVCTDTGYIYLNGVQKNILGSGITAHNKITGMGVMFYSGTQYVYYVTRTSGGAGKIHYSDINLNNFYTALDFTVDATSLNSVVYRSFVINNGLGLLIAFGNKIINLSDTHIISYPYEIQNSESISGFTQFQNTYKIYSNNGNTGIQYIWDGTSDTYQYRQEWINQPVLGVVNDGAFDYATLGFNQDYSDLYLISGTQKQELRVNLEASDSARTLGGYLSIREGIVYISGGSSGQSNNYGVYSFGNYYPGTPKSLVQEFSGGTTYEFTFHVHTGTISYLATEENKVYTISHSNPPSSDNGYNSSGYIVSNIYQGNIWEEKIFNKMKVGFHLTSGTSIKVYIRTSLSDSWKLAKTFDYTTYTTKRGGSIYKNEIESLGLGTFYEFQVKIEFIAGNLLNGTYRNTPILNRVTTFLEAID